MITMKILDEKTKNKASVVNFKKIRKKVKLHLITIYLVFTEGLCTIKFQEMSPGSKTHHQCIPDFNEN